MTVVGGGLYSEQITDYYPFGMSHSTGVAADIQPYKFGGKELLTDNNLNWYDFSARMYDPALGRFMSNDPLTDKYYPVSPYWHCANNPINAYDLNGNSIWYTIDQNIITMHVTGKVYDNSSDNINMDRAAKDIASAISDTFSGDLTLDGKTYTLTTDIQLSVAQSMSNVLDSDHLFVMNNADGKSARGATSMKGGKVMNIAASDYANNNWFSDNFSWNNTRSAVHEFGHAAGLMHESASGWRNLMSQSGGGANVSSEQRSSMVKNRFMINKGPNSLMGQPYPYIHNPKTGKAEPVKKMFNWNSTH